ncbi:MAG: hypothetical protein Q9214_000137 [Letrouitia sp. 1 TL-2023]
MNSNRDGLLTLQNPFFVNHSRLTRAFGVNVLITPTLLTFAQLQNFFTYTALTHQWNHYFWAHMDSPVVSDEEYEQKGKYKSLYIRAIDVMRETMDPDFGELAMRWYSYDRLELVRTKAIVDVGGWDTLIPYYMTDCDMHERLWMKGFKIEDATAGKVYDVASSVDDLEIFYHRTSGPQATNVSKGSQPQYELPPAPALPVVKPDGRSSTAYHILLSKLDEMQRAKGSDKDGRNTWQSRQHGGQGEPFYRDSDGFEDGIQMTMDFGREAFAAKWGRGECNIREAGLTEDDAWRVEADWEKRGTAKIPEG